MKIQILISALLCSVSEVSSYSSFIQNCLDSHNAVRAHYGVPALNWSSEIAVGAQKWANHLAGIDQLQHDSTATEGENLFYMYGGDPEQACDRAVKNWYQEVKNYDFRSPHLDDSTNHFSQLVWRNSKELGIGTAQSKSGNFFLVARYSPPGNINGEFSDNVPAVEEQFSDEYRQEDSNNDINPAQDGSSSPKPNVIYFKEINVDSNAQGPENATEPDRSAPQQYDTQGKAVENSQDSEKNHPATQEPNTQSSRDEAGDGQSPLKEDQSSPQNALNGKPADKGDKTNAQLGSSEQSEGSTNVAPVNEVSDHKQTRPFYPESESADVKPRPNETKNVGAEVQQSKEETKGKDEALEKVTQLPQNYERPKKLHEPPKTDLTYVEPLVPKPPPKKAMPLSLKLPPELELMTPKQGKDFRVEIRFPKMNFSSEMMVPESLAFEEVKRNITSAILNLFDDKDEFLEAKVISLRNGSGVIATLGLLFTKDAPGHLDPLTRALLAGKIGDMPVASKYESAVALPAGYLRLNLPMQERGSGVCAQPCSQPDKCYPAGCSAQCCAFQPPSYKYHTRVSPSVLPSCPGTCDDSCFPDCDNDCCSNMSDLLETSKTNAGSLVAAPPSITCPGSCHFLCYPQCSPQCCSSQPVENPCHSSCPAYCAPSCDTACCASRKSLVNSFSKQYSRYRSAQRTLARSRYLKNLQKRLKLQGLRGLKSMKLARPVRPRQRSVKLREARLRPENPALDEYDHSINDWAKKGQITKNIHSLGQRSGE